MKISTWKLELLKMYLQSLTLQKSERTIEAYTYDVAKFVEFLEEKDVKRAAYLKPAHVTEYLSLCKQRGKSDSSIHRYYMSIKSFTGYLKKNRHVTIDLMENVPVPRTVVKPPRIPSRAQVEAILDAPNTATASGTRDKAILELLYSSGLRASELCDVKLEDFKNDSIVVTGKRNKTRTVPVNEAAAYCIRDYIARYRGVEEGKLFLTIMHKPLSRQFLSKLVVSYAGKASVKEVTPHTLRHTCATHLLDEGADLRLIQEVLGHSSIASTQRYTHLSSNKMQQMFKQFHPRKAACHAESL
jgi:integrase/recombinase XerD